MSNRTSIGEPEFVHDDDAQVRALLHKLGSKLNDFTVVNQQGQSVGKVQDLCLDVNHQLQLVLTHSKHQDGYCYLLSSKLIQDVDPSAQLLYVDISPAELEHLPDYRLTELSMVVPIVPASGSPKKDAMPTPDRLRDDQEQSEFYNLLESPTLEVASEETVRLLEERLVVDRSKRKVGEVIVRKVIETEIVEVPVRREKLIVEQVSPELKQLAKIDLSKGEVSGVELAELVSEQAEATPVESRAALTSDKDISVSGEFTSPKAASLLLEAIALQPHHRCVKVRVEIVLDDPQYLETYQEWFDRCSKG